ncbi:MAG: Ig-like domain-containing protein [Defluviitaleaceae bacterium]|nr:Ig-like domain-containing protein [Defluviitaleaceae bacterium]MCL2238718.1 Ig-like domain-containing protein [Defluviitaleaceae bacterium]
MRKWGKRKIIVVSCIAVFQAALLVLAFAGARYFQRYDAEDETARNITAENGLVFYPVPPVPTPEPPAPPEPPGIAWAFDFALAPSALGGIHITPLSANAWGVEPDSAFLITAQASSAAHLEAYLSVPGGPAFSLEAYGENAFLLHFAAPLARHRVYRFVYRPTGYAPVSHAFQTADVFRVSATSPANNTFQVPHTAGIVITFSQPLAGDISDAFLIYPPVAGRFIRQDNAYVFAPARLLANTTYTVTLRRGLESVTGEILAEDYTFTFQTHWSDVPRPPFSIPRNQEYETFLPWHEVFIGLEIDRDFDGREFSVYLYEMPTAEAFIYFTSTQAGTRFASLTVEAVEVQGAWQSHFYLFLGQSLPEGYFVAEIHSTLPHARHTARKFIQVSGLSVYSLSLGGEKIFWLHDAATGQPAQGAVVHLGTATVTANHEGIAIAQTGAHPRAMITITYGGYLPFVYAQSTFARRPLLPSERFLSYIYTDRSLYRPNDVVDVFGVIIPRYGHSHMPEDVFTLHIGDMLTLPVTLDGHNSFAVRVPVAGMFGYPLVELRVNGERLMELWGVRFFDYANHAFVISGELDNLAYGIDDEAAFAIAVTNFTGMPIADVAVRERGRHFTTDAYGVAAGRLPVFTHGYGWLPRWQSFWFTITGDAQVSQQISLPHIVVPRDIMMEDEFRGDTLTLRTHEIRIDSINEYARALSPWWDVPPDIYRGAAVAVDFTLEITRYTTTRTMRSQRFCHIQRQTFTTYNFHTASALYRTIAGRTENGMAVISGLPVSGDVLIRYSFVVHYRDAQGRETRIWPGQHIWDDWYTLGARSSIRRFHFALERDTLGIGETTQVSLAEGHLRWTWYSDQPTGELTPVTHGRMLTVLAREGIISVAVGSPQGMELTFTEDSISNAFVLGAYFDGQLIFPVANPARVVFDHSTRELEIEMEFDQASYRPGDEVTLTLTTCRPAQVLISVVDEAAFQGRPHQADFLARLYRSATFWHWEGENFSQFASHTQHEFGESVNENGWGGDGDGHNDTFREDFTDNPVFALVQTDENGHATLSFTLPGQVTSWRVTALGLTREGYAGDARENILSALDFYVDLLLTPEYLLGDDIAAVARAHGAGNDSVAFTFAVLQDGAELYAHTTNAVRRASFNAGKLDTGEYTLRVTAAWGTHRDTVELPFAVVATGMIIENQIQGILSPETPGTDPATLTMRDLPLRVTLSNANIRPLARILHGAGSAASQRTDEIAAAAFSRYFFTGEADFDAVRAQVHHWTGGIPQLIRETPNFLYTARFAASFPDMVDRGRILSYIAREAPDINNATARGARLLALAAVGEPVLHEIRAAFAQPAQFGLSDDYLMRLYLVAAMVAIGGHAEAAAMLAAVPSVPPAELSQSTQEHSLVLRLFIHTALDPQLALEYLNRTLENRYVSAVPERVNFVRHAQMRDATVSEVQYTLHGRTHTARLENFDRHSLHITPAQFRALNLTPLSGETQYQIQFYGYDHAHWPPENEVIDIQRALTRTNGLYRVSLWVTLPYGVDGSFTVYDRMPSNTRFVPLHRPWRPGAPFFSVHHVQRQLVELTFFSTARNPRTRTLHYYIMPLFDGDMAPATAYIVSRHGDSPRWGMTQEE